MSMTCFGRLTVALLTIVSLVRGVCSAGQAAYEPKWPVQLATTSGSTTVVLMSQCQDCRIRIVVSRHGATTRPMTLSPTLGIPVGLRIVSPRVAIVIGQPTWFANEVVLFDIETGAVLSEFPAYHPSISPDGRHLAFIQFYPQHGTPEYATTDIARVYDVAYGAAGKYVRNRNDQGQLVYPRPPDGKMHRLESEIIWSSNSSFSYVETVDGKRHKVTVVRDGRSWSAVDGSRRPSA